MVALGLRSITCCVVIESVERPCAEKRTSAVRKSKGRKDAGRGLKQREKKRRFVVLVGILWCGVG